MELTHDYELTLPARVESESCRVRIFSPSETRRHLDAPVVVCTLSDGAGNSRDRRDDPASEAPDVLSPERVAAEIMLAHRLEDFVWISHEVSPKERFYLVVFSHYEIRGIVREDGIWRREIGQPTWKPLDRESVVALTGHPL